MKLDAIFPQIKTEKVQAKRSGPPVASTPASSSLPTDRVVLSGGSLEVQKAKELLANTPEVRADRVEELKERIAKGEYQVDPNRLADKMMSSLLSELPYG